MRCDGFFDRLCAPIVKVGRGSADTPQGRRAEVVNACGTIFDAEAVCQPYVVEEQIGIGADVDTIRCLQTP